MVDLKSARQEESDTDEFVHGDCYENALYMTRNPYQIITVITRKIRSTCKSSSIH